MAMALVINKQINDHDSLSFPLILTTTEILNHCNDYEILKMIQLTSSKINDLFTCPSQSVWKQLCHRKRYKFPLKREAARCLFRQSKMIWETIYYQNWRVERNWNDKIYETVQLANPEKRLVKMVNGGTVLGLSVSLDPTDGSVKILDLKHDIQRSKKASGQITSSCLQSGLLIIGKSCGSMTIFRLTENTENTAKLHSKEITSIILYKDFIVSGDIGGQIIKTSQIDPIIPIVLYQSDSGITGLHQNGNEIFATTINGDLIEISHRNNGTIHVKRLDFGEFGSINCITGTKDELIILGTDSGKLNILNRRRGQQTIKLLKASPIISIAADSKRIISGHFDGTISIYTLATGKVFIDDFGGMAPVWSVGIDEISFISSSLSGKVLLRQFL